MKKMTIKWSVYAECFRREAMKYKFDADYIKRCLTYGKALYEKGLPIIYDQEHLAVLVGYSKEYLYRASNGPSYFYRKFKIPKISGGLRKIAEPLPSLKEIQRWILDNILYNCKFNKYAKAFIPGKSIRENARFHRNQKIVLSLDMKNFFESIPSYKIYHFFWWLGYCKAVATMLTNLCTLNGSLPQGAPTSPALSNLVCYSLDCRLSGFTVKNNIRYTRYSDDLTFSGEFNPGSVIRLVEKILYNEGFELNKNKIRLMKNHNRQEVTGIVVNDKMQAVREIRRKLRQDIYYIEKYGLDSHMDFAKQERANYVNHLRGKANFVLFVNSKDRDANYAFKVLNNY